MSEEMIERHQGDEMIRLTLMDGQVRVMMCETTQMAQRAADIHGATPVCTAAILLPRLRLPAQRSSLRRRRLSKKDFPEYLDIDG